MGTTIGTPWRHAAIVLLLAALLQAAWSPAWGAGLRVSPLRLDLTERNRSGTLTLENLSGTPVAVEVTLMRWTQQGDRDVLEPSRDLFFAPPIVSVPAGGDAAIRLRTRRLPEEGQESTYRLYVRELPGAQSRNAKGAGLALRIGLPIYVTNGAVPPPRLSVSGQRTPSGLRLTLRNSGDSHIKIKGIEVHGAGVDRRAKPPTPRSRGQRVGPGTNDLMPGAFREWLIPDTNLPEDAQVLLRTDDTGGRAADGMLRNGWLWLRLSDLLAQ